MKLTRKEYDLYRLLEACSDMWLTKEDIIDALPQHFNKGDETSHDVCSTLNTIRLKLNRAAHEGIINHIVLLNNNSFKIATSKEEAEKYCKRDFDNAMKLLVRYYQNIGIIKRDGQGRLIDCNGNVITEESFAKRYYTVFEG